MLRALSVIVLSAFETLKQTHIILTRCCTHWMTSFPGINQCANTLNFYIAKHRLTEIYLCKRSAQIPIIHDQLFFTILQLSALTPKKARKFCVNRGDNLYYVFVQICLSRIQFSIFLRVFLFGLRERCLSLTSLLFTGLELFHQSYL